MRTRNQSKRPDEASNSDTVTDKLMEDVDINLKGTTSRISKRRKGCSNNDDGAAVKPVKQDDERNVTKGEEPEDPDWEDGYISVSDNKNGYCDNVETRVSQVTVEFTESPSSSSKQKVARRASAEDKELAELVHKVHLLCLLARGKLIDEACCDPLIQAGLLSLLPIHLLKVAEFPKLTAKALIPLVNWFQGNFHVHSMRTTEEPFMSRLAHALETREGTSEEVAALSVALFRALNLPTRFVSILDVTSLKPDIDTSGSLKQDAIWVGPGVSSSSSSKMMATSHRIAAIAPVQSSDNKETNEGIGCGGPKRGLPEMSTTETRQNNSVIDKPEGSGTKLTERLKRKGDLEFELEMEMALSATAAGAGEINLGADFPDSGCNSSDTASPLKKMKKIRSEESPGLAVLGYSGAAWSRKVGPPLYWAEIFCSGEVMTGRWVHVDAASAIVDGEQKVESAAAACRRLLRYVIAFAGQGAKDVTRRYCMKWYTIASQRISSVWWDAVLAPLKELESGATGGGVHLEGHSEKGRTTELHASLEASSNKIVESHKQNFFTASSSRSALEDMELETRALTEPLPTNQQAYKNHHLYAMERWLTKYQILHPKGPILGFCSGNPVYSRTCVHTLQTKNRWLREGLQVKANEQPAKVIKCSRKLTKVQKIEPSASEEEDGEGVIELYGKWQMEPLNLPHAVNGIVPKNERGQVDVWSEKCLPPGTVHLRFPRLVPVVKRLGVDFAPAMVGFEFRSGRALPVFEGLVVCREFKDAILEAYAEEEERREAQEKKRYEAQAISRWYQLLSSILTRQRLKNSYEEEPVSLTPHSPSEKDDQCGTLSGEALVSKGSRQVHHLGSDSQFAACSGDHEHVFPIENQSFDEESSMRTKRCPCGFSIQVEEM